MKIPKYVIELMSRARYEYDRCTKSPNYGSGYTISIQKSTEYARIRTLRAEVERLCNWANRAVPGSAFLLYIPTETHYTKQSAVVSIFDPVMQRIEQYIPSK